MKLSFFDISRGCPKTYVIWDFSSIKVDSLFLPNVTSHFWHNFHFWVSRFSFSHSRLFHNTFSPDPLFRNKFVKKVFVELAVNHFDVTTPEHVLPHKEFRKLSKPRARHNTTCKCRHAGMPVGTCGKLQVSSERTLHRELLFHLKAEKAPKSLGSVFHPHPYFNAPSTHSPINRNCILRHKLGWKVPILVGWTQSTH